jgi:hypothetical protein
LSGPDSIIVRCIIPITALFYPHTFRPASQLNRILDKLPHALTVSLSRSLTPYTRTRMTSNAVRSACDMNMHVRIICLDVWMFSDRCFLHARSSLFLQHSRVIFPPSRPWQGDLISGVLESEISNDRIYTHVVSGEKRVRRRAMCLCGWVWMCVRVSGGAPSRVITLIR